MAMLISIGAASQVRSQGSSNTVLDYTETFDGNSATGFFLEPGWSLVRSEGGYALKADGLGHTQAIYEFGGWSDYRFRCRVRIDADSAHVSYRNGATGRYYFSIRDTGITLNKQLLPDTFFNDLAAGPGVTFGAWHLLEIDGVAGDIRMKLDGDTILTYTDADPLASGGLFFEAFGGTMYIDDIELYVSAALAPPSDLTWVRTGGPLGGLGYDIRVHPAQPGLLFVSDAFSGVFTSDNRGQYWEPINDGIVTRAGNSGDAIPVFCLALAPNDPQTVWVGTQNARGIYRSADAGQTWLQRDNGVLESTGITFRGIAVDPNNANVVYAAGEVSSWVWAGEPRMGREFDMTQGVVYRSANGGESWTPVWRGDNLARYVWIDPRDSDTIYVSTGIFDREAANSTPAARLPGGEGVIKSIDGGQTWTHVNNGLNNLFVGSLFMHPTNPDILLAGTGHVQYHEGGGVYLTINGGASWQHTLAEDHVITAVEFATSDPNVAYAGSPDAVHRSADGGQTWETVSGGFDGWGPPGVRAGFPIDFQVAPDDPDTLFVNNYGGGNFLSTDGGRTWSVASRGYTGAQVRDIAIDPSAPGRLFAAARSGIFRTNDGGNGWSALNVAPASSLEWGAVAIDPKDSSRVLAANNWNTAILESTHGGADWRLVSPVLPEGPPGQGWRAIVFAPSDTQRVYAGASAYYSAGAFDDELPASGVYISTDGGQTWSAANNALSADANVTALAVATADPDTVFAATGNHGVLSTTDGGRTWTERNTGLPDATAALSIAINPQNSQHLFVGLASGAVHQSTDGGRTWSAAGVGMNPQARVSDIVIDPNDPATVFAADKFSGVYRSTDGGATWVRLNQGLRTRDVNSLALSSDAKHLYAATEGEGVFRLDLAGEAPSAVTEPVADDDGDQPTDPDADPIDGDDPTDGSGDDDSDGNDTTDGGNVNDDSNAGDQGSGAAGAGCGAGIAMLSCCIPFYVFMVRLRRSKR
jgi:photosystem II stability/assembly factor-like uncharacterized protein